MISFDFWDWDWDWYSLSLNFEIKAETGFSESQCWDRVWNWLFLSLNNETKSETKIIWEIVETETDTKIGVVIMHFTFFSGTFRIPEGQKNPGLFWLPRNLYYIVFIDFNNRTIRTNDDEEKGKNKLELSSAKLSSQTVMSS